MLVYTVDGGYNKVDLEETRKVIEKHLPMGSRDKAALLELLYDYECLRNVINGKNCCFRHPDGSETRRLKLWS